MVLVQRVEAVYSLRYSRVNVEVIERLGHLLGQDGVFEFPNCQISALDHFLNPEFVILEEDNWAHSVISKTL